MTHLMPTSLGSKEALVESCHSKVALQCNELAITAGFHKLLIKSNFSTEDYMQMLDEHLMIPAGLINTACCIIAITELS